MKVQRFRRPFPAVSSLLAALLLLTASCGGNKRAYPVRGKVLDAKDRPAAGALVVLHPADGTHDPPRPLARVGEDGTFALTTYTQHDGAPVGDYAVTIEWPVPRKSPFDAEGPDRLHGRYRDPMKPIARFQVEPRADNEVPVIRLPETGGPR